MNWRYFHHGRWLAGLSAAGLAAGFAPALRADDTQWFGMNGLPQVSAGLDAEGSTERTKVSGGTSTYDHFSITPLVGMRSTGFIYHPNLLTYDVSGDLGWGWDSMKSDGSGANQSVNESAELLRYLAQFDLFAAKPCNASVFASQDHSFRDYGSLNTYTVDTTRYGGRWNWSVDSLTLNADLGYRKDDASGLNDSSDITETYFNFLGIQKRKSGETSLALHADNLENVLSFGGRLDTKSWSAGASDSETFGQRHQISASTGLSYSQSEYSGQKVDTVNATENVLVNHRPKLDSYYMVNFSRSELRPITESSRVQGTAGVRHQLYDSLTSDLEGHGTYQKDAASTGDSTFDLFGVGLSENYTKRLQSLGRLGVGTGIIVDHQNQTSPAGILTTFDEPHTLYSPSNPKYLQPVYLSRPRIVSIVQISVSGDTLVSGSDYTTATSGDLTEIKLIAPVSAHVQTLLQSGDNLSVTVTYQSESLGNSSYDTLNASVQMRLDLRGGFGIYGRLNWLDNNAPPEVLTQTLTDLIGGVDYKRKWFRTGAEYENFNSTYTQYQAMRFFQDLDFVLSDASSLSFDFNETFYSYEKSGDQSQYQFMTRYNTRLALTFTWYVECGGLLQDVAGTEQVVGLARTGIGWTRGKLNVRAGYEFNSQSTTSSGFTEERVKHRFFSYLRRSF